MPQDPHATSPNPNLDPAPRNPPLHAALRLLVRLCEALMVTVLLALLIVRTPPELLPDLVRAAGELLSSVPRVSRT